MQSVEQLAAEVIERFGARFGGEPRWVSCAPGRVNLIGEHLDYNDGFVLPMAIGLQTVVAASPNHTRRMRVESSASPGLALIELDSSSARGEPAWANYLRGVSAGMGRKALVLPGLDVFIHSSIPLGGGLSSSAALQVAFTTVLEAACGKALAPLEKVLLCQAAEHEFAGTPCGIMDPFISVFAQEGRLLMLDCRSNEAAPIPFADPAVSVLIMNSGVRHALGGGEYARRRAECEGAARLLGVSSLRDVPMSRLIELRDLMPAPLFQRARHVVSEIARTLEAGEAARLGKWERFGALMDQSHESLRDDFEVSCAEVDLLVEAARAIGLGGGVFGSRMTGGGFGGCTVTLVKTAMARQVSGRMAEAYRAKTGISAAAVVSGPVAGARLLRG